MGIESSKKLLIFLLISLSLAVVLLSIILTVFAALVVPILQSENLMIGISSQRRQRQPTSFFARHPIRCQEPHTWRDTTCCQVVRRCAKSWSRKPVLLISMDGFRADYLKQNKTSALERLIECGSHAPFMYPSYPSITFPNHYTIVTGLYPESSGIVDNHMYDPSIYPPRDRRFDRGKPGSYNSMWWHGEPFWNTVIKNGMKSATYFWPGSEMLIQSSSQSAQILRGRSVMSLDMRPTYWLPFDMEMPFSNRVDQVIQWLMLPEADRPSFITLYFQEPDHNGHVYGPFSPQVYATDTRVSVCSASYVSQTTVRATCTQYVRTFVPSADRFQLLGVLGMQKVYDDPSTKIFLDQYFDVSKATVFDGPVGRIMLNGALSKTDVVNRMKCKNESFRVYSREDVPNRLHLSRNPRIGDIVVDTNPGYEVKIRRNVGEEGRQGEHGYDYRFNSMHAIFISYGPDIKQSFAVEPFANVEIFNLMADLLDIRDLPPNNGTRGSLRNILIFPPNHPENRFREIQACQLRGNHVQTCTCNFPVDRSAACSSLVLIPPIVTATVYSEYTCQLSHCSSSVVYNLLGKFPVVEESWMYGDTDLETPNSDCCFTMGNLPGCTEYRAAQSFLQQRGMSLKPLLRSNSSTMQFFHQKVPMFRQFEAKLWTPLQKLARTYARRFGRLLLVAGPIFDYDADGVADSAGHIPPKEFPPEVPTHYFMVMVGCETGWGSGRMGLLCPQDRNAKVLSFVLPHKEEMENCQSVEDYFYTHTGRVRDIETLTQLIFFENRIHWKAITAIRLRLHVNQRLWDKF